VTEAVTRRAGRGGPGHLVRARLRPSGTLLAPRRRPADGRTLSRCVTAWRTLGAARIVARDGPRPAGNRAGTGPGPGRGKAAASPGRWPASGYSSL